VLQLNGEACHATALPLRLAIESRLIM
jgi:hypothetical protein